MIHASACLISHPSSGDRQHARSHTPHNTHSRTLAPTLDVTRQTCCAPRCGAVLRAVVCGWHAGTLDGWPMCLAPCSVQCSLPTPIAGKRQRPRPIVVHARRGAVAHVQRPRHGRGARGQIGKRGQSPAARRGRVRVAHIDMVWRRQSFMAKVKRGRRSCPSPHRSRGVYLR